jgi:hypothetical protein
MPLLGLSISSFAYIWAQKAAIEGTLRGMWAAAPALAEGAEAEVAAGAAGIELGMLQANAAAAGVELAELGEAVVEVAEVEMEAGAAGGPVGLVVAGVVAVASAGFMAFMLKAEQQMHFVVNFSKFAFSMRPSADILNMHGKTIAAPSLQNDMEGSNNWMLPARDAENGDPTLAALAFSKNDNAINPDGGTGAYQFHPMGELSKKCVPGGIKIFYRQPEAPLTHNGVGCYCDNGYSLEKIFKKFDEGDALLTHSYHNGHVKITVALDSRSGSSNYAVVVIEDV